MSRTSTYTQEIADEICDRMAEGKSLREICKSDDMPSRKTVLRWVDGNKDFREQYVRARDAQYDWIAEEAIRIADDSSQDYFIEEKNGRSVVVPDHARVQRARLQVDTRKWILSKLAPRKYGDKVELLAASEGETGSKTVKVSWSPAVRVIVYPMLGPDGRLLPPDSPQYKAALERAVKEAQARAEAKGANNYEETATAGTPLNLPELDEKAVRIAQISYQPEFPAELSQSDRSTLTEILELIKRTIPTNADKPPAEILGILREALLEHFRAKDSAPAP